MELTPKQRLYRYQDMQRLSETTRSLLAAIEDAEKIAANAAGLAKYGHDLYRIKNNLRLDLEALAEQASMIANP